MTDHPQKLNPRPGDPFFQVINDGEWNATLGQQGDVENYLDGYIDAAIELADAIFEKDLHGKRDTLVLPILYNARHALELNLKFATDNLNAAGILKDEKRKLDHDIARYLQGLLDSRIPDLELKATLECLKPFVDSLAQIDRDGQELRYHRNRDDEISLAQFAIVNLRLVRSSLHGLKKLLETVKCRTIDLIEEQRTGTFTASCSRKDLYAIARALPQRSEWSTPAFDKCKDEIKETYSLSSNGFQKAISIIESTRELRSIIGLASDLLYLTDDEILWAASQWRRLHPRTESAAESRAHVVNAADLRGELLSDHTAEIEIYRTISSRLDATKIAEMTALFYLGRDRYKPEFYAEMVADTLRHTTTEGEMAKLRSLITKTNFLTCIVAATSKIGRRTLSTVLKELDQHSTHLHEE